MDPVFRWRADEPGLTRVVTSRGGGGSTGPYAGLNLGGHVGDDPRTVEANRATLAAALGVPRDRLLFMNQCHGASVHVVDGSWPDDEPAPAVDALVTTSTDLALAVLVADCVPILLSDVHAGVIAAVHAGRPGLAGGIVPATVAAMRDLGAAQLQAVVGPSVCGRCYEVPAAMRAEVAAVAPASATVSWSGTPALDVAAGVVSQLADVGVAVSWLPGCTREDPTLYSYRAAQVTGRFAGAILRPEVTTAPAAAAPAVTAATAAATAADDADGNRTAYR